MGGGPRGGEVTEAEEDAEANYFAMCLLMPQHMVHSEVDRLVMAKKWDEAGVKQLARTFGVSEIVMTIRLTQLGRILPP